MKTRYFIYENNLFSEIENSLNYHIRLVPMDNIFVVHMMGSNPYPNVDCFIDFVETNKPNKLVIDFTSAETYVDVNVVQEFEDKLSCYGFDLKILSVNIVNNKFKSHVFFPVHAFQLIDTFDSIFEPSLWIQEWVMNTKKRLKKYLFLNHHLRTERFKIFESLYNNNKLNDGLISFCWNMENEKFNPNSYSISQNDVEYIKNSKAYTLLPIELDGMNTAKIDYNNVRNEIQNPVFFSPPNTNLSHYFNVYFEIITEGFSYTTPYHDYVDRYNLLHYSEKIYKPILFGIPFCFWGPENTLEQFSNSFGFSFKCPLYYCNNDYNLESFCEKVNELISLPYNELHKLYYDYFDEFKKNQHILYSYIKNLYI